MLTKWQFATIIFQNKKWQIDTNNTRRGLINGKTKQKWINGRRIFKTI